MPRGAQTITVKRPQERDWQGDPTGTAPEPVVVRGVIVWPQSTRETADQGIVVLEDMAVYLPPRPALVPTAADVIEFEGRDYRVQGAVGHYVGKRGQDKGYMFTMRRLGVRR